MKNRNKDLTQGSLIKAIMTLAIPVVITSFLQSMYNLTDTYWLGKLGTEELAAINLVTPVQNIVQNFGSGLTVAGAVLISQYIGAKKIKDARSMANQIFVCAMIFSLACALMISLLSGEIVSWLGADGNTKRYAINYLSLVIWDMPFLYTVNIYQSVHQAQGDTVSPMLLNFLGICINLIMDPLLMVGLGLGASGAALATVFAKLIPSIVAFAKLNNRKNDLFLELKNLKFEREKIRNIFVIGLPTAIGGATMQLGFLLMSKSVYVYGTKAMAAYGIGNKVNGLISLPANGIGSAISTMVGQNVGAGNYKRAEKGYRISMAISVGLMFTGGMILSRPPVSTAIVKIFTDDPDVILMAAEFFGIMAFWVFTNGVYNSTMGLFQGSGHTEVTMMIDASRLWVFRFATLFVCQSVLNLGVESIWYSVVVSNGISAVLLFLVYLTGYWKKARVSNKEMRRQKAQTLIEEESNESSKEA